jgi:hypothetical protein
MRYVRDLLVRRILRKTDKANAVKCGVLKIFLVGMRCNSVAESLPSKPKANGLILTHTHKNLANLNIQNLAQNIVILMQLRSMESKNNT